MDNVNNKEFILAKLDAMLISRKESSPEKSYVASLYNKGNEYINRKLLEVKLSVLHQLSRGNTEKFKMNLSKIRSVIKK